MAISLSLVAPSLGGCTGSLTATKTSTDTTSKFSVQTLTQMTIQVTTSAVSGTSPTLDVYVQKLLPDGSTWQDIAAFTQFTGNATRVMHLVSGGNLEEAASEAALTAGTTNSVPFGRWWRLKFKIGGTNPSFTIAAALEGLV